MQYTITLLNSDGQKIQKESNSVMIINDTLFVLSTRYDPLLQSYVPIWERHPMQGVMTLISESEKQEAQDE